MRKRKIVMIPLMIVAAAVFVFVGGWVVMHLWNWLLPALFGWRLITFWQALGMLVLCRILFGRWGGGRGGAFRRGPRGWQKMTPEEKAEWRRKMMERCGGEEAPSAG